MVYRIDDKDDLLYNSIPDQNLYSPAQLTIQEWNRTINQLRQQANANTEYLKRMHKWLIGSEGSYEIEGTVLDNLTSLLYLQSRIDEVEHAIQIVPLVLSLEDTLSEDDLKKIKNRNVAHIEYQNLMYTFDKCDDNIYQYTVMDGTDLNVLSINADTGEYTKDSYTYLTAITFKTHQDFLDSIVIDYVDNKWKLISIDSHPSQYLNIGLNIYIGGMDKDYWLAYKESTYAPNANIDLVKLSLFEELGHDHAPINNIELENILKEE